MMPTCTHPPARLYSWWARDDRLPHGGLLCVVCLACRAILRGGA